jgi:tRNA-dihydrouridine synthase 2
MELSNCNNNSNDFPERGNFDYKDKLILAPMVRVGVLPFRLMCLENGADIVYSEELIAFKLKKTIRVVNKVDKTIDFLEKGSPSSKAVFRTCEQDRPVVLQLGASDSVNALEAASIV